MVLAGHLGKSLRECMSSVDSREFTRWKAFDRVSPIGDWRADRRAGLVAAAVYNVHRTGNQEPAKSADFIYKWEPPAPPATDEDVEQQVDSVFLPMVAK